MSSLLIPNSGHCETRRFVAMTALATVRWCRLYEAVCEGKLYLSSARWQYVSDHAKDLVRQMLTASAEERLTVEEALNHRCGVNIRAANGT